MPPSLAKLFTPQPTIPIENRFPEIVEDPNAYVEWPQYTMVNPIILNDYIYRVVWECWESWEKGKDENPRIRVTKLHDIISYIHQRCGIPTTKYLETYLGTPGSFLASGWCMNIGTDILSSRIIEPKNFLSVAETIYHEGRHAEQAWLVAVEHFFAIRERNTAGIFEIPWHIIYLTHTNYFGADVSFEVLKKAAEVACKRPEIPLNLSVEARTKREKFVEMIHKIHEAWWGKNQQQSQAIMEELHNSMDNWEAYYVAYHKYLNLPYERDTHAVQMLIRGLHERMGDFNGITQHLGQIPKDFKPLY